MQALIKSKGFLGLFILFIVGMFIYNSFTKTDSSAPDYQPALEVGKDLLALSADLSRAQLSQQLFSVPSYLFLTDFSAPLPVQPLGRINPFDLIGR